MFRLSIASSVSSLRKTSSRHETQSMFAPRTGLTGAVSIRISKASGPRTLSSSILLGSTMPCKHLKPAMSTLSHPSKVVDQLWSFSPLTQNARLAS